MFQHFKNEVENQLDRKIKVIRSDRGGEYEAPFGDFCSQHGITKRLHPIHLSKMGLLNVRTEL